MNGWSTFSAWGIAGVAKSAAVAAAVRTGPADPDPAIGIGNFLSTSRKVVDPMGNGKSAVTLKRFYRERGRIRLQPANPYVEPIIVSEVAIQGKVVAVVRRFD